MTKPNALKNLKARMAQRRRDLADPKWADPRRFPVWRVGVTTADYLLWYEYQNADRHLTNPWGPQPPPIFIPVIDLPQHLKDQLK